MAGKPTGLVQEGFESTSPAHSAAFPMQDKNGVVCHELVSSFLAFCYGSGLTATLYQSLDDPRQVTMEIFSITASMTVSAAGADHIRLRYWPSLGILSNLHILSLSDGQSFPVVISTPSLYTRSLLGPVIYFFPFKDGPVKSTEAERTRGA